MIIQSYDEMIANIISARSLSWSSRHCILSQIGFDHLIIPYNPPHGHHCAPNCQIGFDHTIIIWFWFSFTNTESETSRLVYHTLSNRSSITTITLKFANPVSHDSFCSIQLPCKFRHFSVSTPSWTTRWRRTSCWSSTPSSASPTLSTLPSTVACPGESSSLSWYGSHHLHCQQHSHHEAQAGLQSAGPRWMVERVRFWRVNLSLLSLRLLRSARSGPGFILICFNNGQQMIKNLAQQSFMGLLVKALRVSAKPNRAHQCFTGGWQSFTGLGKGADKKSKNVTNASSLSYIYHHHLHHHWLYQAIPRDFLQFILAMSLNHHLII